MYKEEYIKCQYTQVKKYNKFQIQYKIIDAVKTNLLTNTKHNKDNPSYQQIGLMVRKEINITTVKIKLVHT